MSETCEYCGRSVGDVHVHRCFNIKHPEIDRKIEKIVAIIKMDKIMFYTSEDEKFKELAKKIIKEMGY